MLLESEDTKNVFPKFELASQFANSYDDDDNGPADPQLFTDMNLANARMDASAQRLLEELMSQPEIVKTLESIHKSDKNGL